MKKEGLTSPRVRLSRETLRRLDAEELSAVVGGDQEPSNPPTVEPTTTISGKPTGRQGFD